MISIGRVVSTFRTWMGRKFACIITVENGTFLQVVSTLENSMKFHRLIILAEANSPQFVMGWKNNKVTCTFENFFFSIFDRRGYNMPTDTTK